MKQTLQLLLFYLLAFTSCAAQENNIWHGYLDDTNNLIGFKDAAGNIKIEPKFTGFTSIKKFEYIVIVMEDSGNKWDSYYLLKNGKKVGRDSINFRFDFELECESEGFIQFHDRKTDCTGMFDRNGKVAIPAYYSTISPFTNGLAVATKGAFRYNPEIENPNHEGCNHWRWRGGVSSLINTKNEVIIENFTDDGKLDLYSLEISASPTDDATRDSFIGVNGKYYSFVNKDRLFDRFVNSFVNSKSKEEVLAYCYPDITYEKKGSMITTTAKQYLDENYDRLANYFKLLLNPRRFGYYKEDEPFFSIPFELRSQLEYMSDNCGNHNYMKHPLKALRLLEYRENGRFETHLCFIKTEDGYKLIYIYTREDEY